MNTLIIVLIVSESIHCLVSICILYYWHKSNQMATRHEKRLEESWPYELEMRIHNHKNLEKDEAQVDEWLQLARQAQKTWNLPEQ